MLGRPLTGELGIRNVLFDETAELGVRVVDDESWVLPFTADPGPKMEFEEPAGVEG